MDKWIKLGETLRGFVNPSTLPVAVKFLGDASEIPKKARRPLRDLKVRLAPCQGAAMTRRYGWTVAFTREDVGCAIAAHTYGWERATDKEGAIYFLTRMKYAADEKAAEGVLADFPLLHQDRIHLNGQVFRTGHLNPDLFSFRHGAAGRDRPLDQDGQLVFRKPDPGAFQAFQMR